jgi:hypothetical protein
MTVRAFANPDGKVKTVPDRALSTHGVQSVAILVNVKMERSVILSMENAFAQLV